MRNFSKAKEPGVLRALNFSDIHLIHRQTPTKDLVNQFWKCLSKEDSESLDLITISGDIFDMLSQFVTDDVKCARAWGTRLMRHCKRHNIILVLLEGTDSHDVKQARWFIEQNESAEIHADVRYYEKLCIVDEDFGLKMLYLPDNYSHDPAVTLADVKALIEKHGDPDGFLIHQGFEYQLPPEALVSATVHSSDEYNALAKRGNAWIISGHIHLRSQKDRIRVGGSFGRLAHGEEGAKGYIRYTLREDYNDEWVFVDNPYANIYKTITAYGITAEELSPYIESKTKGLPDRSNVRIKCKAEDVAAGVLPSIKIAYPNFNWAIKVDKKQNKSILGNSFVNNVVVQGGNLTEDNLSRLLLDRIKTKHPHLNPLDVSRWLAQNNI